MPSSARGLSPAPDGEHPARPRPSARWHGRLDLSFDDGPSGTRLVGNRHEGPLRLLKALLSEDERRLEAVIVHPPGGLVGGDSLAVDLRVGKRARVLATTPGAQKWYRGDTTATSTTRLVVAGGAMLEWLPQPALLFDGARACQAVSVELEPGACCVGWEILVRGRHAMGEVLASGDIDQTLSLSVAGGLLWQERLHAGAADRLFDSPIGWDRRRMAASVWCCAPASDAPVLAALREQWRALLAAGGRGANSVVGGATLVADGLLLAKMLADDGEALMSLCRQLWRSARMSLEGDAGSSPRIWRT